MKLDQRAQENATKMFVHEWFDLLSKHAPVGQLLPYISDTKLEMTLPERTIRSHADFLDWYADIGADFTDQAHTVKELSSQINGDAIDVALTVIWAVTQMSSGARSTFHVNQHWNLAMTKDEPWRIIQKYSVMKIERV